MSIFRKLFGSSTDTPPSPSVEPPHRAPPPPFDSPVQMKWTSRTIAGRTPVNVVGESYRQDAFERAVGPRTAEGATVKPVTVQLVRDPANPHDPDAIAVYLGPEHVGYVSADETTAWHPVITALNSAGYPASCHGEVTGGWQRPGDAGNYGLVFYADYPPRQMTQADPVLTIGRGRVQIQGEDEHQLYLFGLLDRRPAADIVVALSVGDDGTVTAVHDGQVIGTMTAKMSERYAPALEYLRRSGWPATCSALVSPGKTKLEVALRLPTKDMLESLL